MEDFIFRHEEWILRYNCTFFDIDKIPLENRRHPFIGISMLILSIIFECLYIPVLISINKHSRFPCYNLMRFIGIFDMINIPIVGTFTGFGFIFGWVYCSSPLIIYFLGTIAIVSWMIVAMASLILAFNRCVEMLSPRLGKFLFYGKRIYIYQAIPLIYGFYDFWYKKPALFSAALGAYFFNPFVLYYETDFEHYFSKLHSFNNIMVVVTLPLLYIVFFVALSIKVSILHRGENNKDIFKIHVGTFIQVLIISIINVSGCLVNSFKNISLKNILYSIYVVMQFFEVNSYIIFCGTYFWLLVHGLPAIIYILINKTIQSDCKEMILKLNSTKVGVILMGLQQEANNNGPSMQISSLNNC